MENVNQDLNKGNEEVEVNEAHAQVQEEANIDTDETQISDSPEPEETSHSSAEFEIGDTVHGTVVSIEDKFIKVNIDNSDFDGIVPISQLTNKRIEKPHEIINLDDSVSGFVLKVEDEENRKNVIFSIRKLDEKNVYDKLRSLLDNDEPLEGVVTEVVKAGLVVDVGVRGFIPASLVSDTYVEDLEQFDGQTLKVKVEEVDEEKNRVILNRSEIVKSEKHKERLKKLNNIEVGSIIDGEVVRTTNFGVFIDIGGVDGLAHISELSHSHVDKVEDVVAINDKVQVKVLDVKPEEERVSLSIKEAEESPFSKFATQTSDGDVLNGTVKRLVDFGAFVEVSPGVEGLVHISEISHDHVTLPSDVLEEELQVKVKVLSIDEDAEKVSLSIKETTEAPKRPQRKEESVTTYSSNDDDSPTLGDVFGDRFRNLDI